MKTVEPMPAALPFSLPPLARRRPRSYEEWSALRRWGRLPTDERLVVGYLLREAREGAGSTQAALAERLGCSQQAVSQAEEWRSNPTVDFMRRWAAAVGADLEIALSPFKRRSRRARG